MENTLEQASNELEAASARLLDEDTKRINNMLSRAYQELVETTDKALIPEHVFIQYFLPYFKNPDAAENRDSVILNKWVEMAGGPYNEVSIIGNQGEVLFDVPAIYNKDTVNLDILKESNVDLNYVGKAYDNMVTRAPDMGEAVINEGLSNLPKFVNNINNNVELRGRWDKIFKRYEYLDEENAILEESHSISREVKENLGLNYDSDDYDSGDDDVL